ncbi:hypothetical protein C8F04DRAFT_1234597 [Mycena alexandri]|uniref:Uncharacterized protein n=1 Tax=Mycena alexandri TaxID=1745969 RepID=A0AAD6X241_9AGAR|nr:hypothetical protein C8F04DRAFT_1234597 [Mycena alexandri]
MIRLPNQHWDAREERIGSWRVQRAVSAGCTRREGSAVTCRRDEDVGAARNIYPIRRPDDQDETARRHAPTRPRQPQPRVDPPLPFPAIPVHGSNISIPLLVSHHQGPAHPLHLRSRPRLRSRGRVRSFVVRDAEEAKADAGSMPAAADGAVPPSLAAAPAPVPARPPSKGQKQEKHPAHMHQTKILTAERVPDDEALHHSALRLCCSRAGAPVTHTPSLSTCSAYGFQLLVSTMTHWHDFVSEFFCAMPAESTELSRELGRTRHAQEWSIEERSPHPSR